MASASVWHGTPLEALALNEALAHNCGCSLEDGRICPGHTMMLDQRVLDALVFYRRIVIRLCREEFGINAA